MSKMTVKTNVNTKEGQKFVHSLFRTGEVSVETKDVMSTFGDMRIPIALGLIPGISTDSFIGTNPDIDSNISEDLIYQGGRYEFMVVADFLNIFSTDDEDTLLGSGARTLALQGLGENHEPITELINLDGQNTVTTINKFIRLNNVFVINTGSNERNIGIISIEDAGTGLITVGTIGLDSNGNGLNRMFQFIYTVPMGMTAMLMQLTGSISRGSGSSSIKEAMTCIHVRPNVINTFFPVGVVASRSDGSSINTADLNYPVALTERTDIKATGLSLSNNVQLTFSASLLLIDNATFGL